jgi:hypothetical protein
MISRKAALSGRFLRTAETFVESVRHRDPIGSMSRYEPERDAPVNVLFVCSRNQWRSPTGEQLWRRHPA